MVEINGKEIGLLYSVGVRCDLDDYVLANPTASMSRAIVKQAAWMSKAYCDVYGGEPITEQEIYRLPQSEYGKLRDAVRKQQEEDSKITVELEDSGKKAKSTAR